MIAYIYIYIFSAVSIYIFMDAQPSLSVPGEVWGGTKQRCAYKDSPLRPQYKFAYLLYICICVCLSLWIAVIPTISNCPQNSLSFSVTYTTNNAQLAPNRHICETQLQLLITGPSIISHNQNHNRIKDESNYWALNVHKVNAEYARAIYICYITLGICTAWCRK